MAAKIFVGNLPHSVTEEGLIELFSQAGTVVSVSLPKDRLTGRPRRFGFLEMESSAQADEAVRNFDGYLLDNRPIRVQIAKEEEERAPGLQPSPGREAEHGVEGRREERGPQDREDRGMAA